MPICAVRLTVVPCEPFFSAQVSLLYTRKEIPNLYHRLTKVHVYISNDISVYGDCGSDDIFIEHPLGLTQVHADVYLVFLAKCMSVSMLSSSSGDLATKTISSAKIKCDTSCSPSIYTGPMLIPLPSQMIWLIMASCSHSAKTFGEMLSPCLTPLA